MTDLQRPAPPISAPGLLAELVALACHQAVAQLDAFGHRLANALLAVSEQSSDAREANLTFNSGQLLKNNGYAFYYLASAEIEAALRAAQLDLLSGRDTVPAPDIELSLVSYEEMDKKLTFARAGRTIELANAESYLALNMRLASLLGREALSMADNPFRPDVFLQPLYAAWREFNPDPACHDLVLPLLRADIVFDLAPLLHALNEVLVERGVLPDLQESYRVKKSAARDAERNDPVAQMLQRLFDGSSGMAGMAGTVGTTGGGAAGMAAPVAGNAAAGTRLFQYLAGLQQDAALRQLAADADEVVRLSQLRERLPELNGAGVEQHTLDLLAHIFDAVLGNPEIPTQVKQLIAVLQIPVLKAALLDKEFFFQEQHPARRLIDLLSRYSLACDQRKGRHDPWFQTMQAGVERIRQDFGQELGLFDEVVADLENFIEKEEAASAAALQAPIKQALRQEKVRQAGLAASHEVALRVGSGEVVAFVEAFLENRWTKVLTLAYTVQDEKPYAVQDAIKTMDDLIWSVKPKITLQQRQELVNRLPAILARLNKWLSLIKWDDADRVQFFADLAECHASIVRAPLDLAPERQLEIAVEAAQQAAERRLAKRAEADAGTASGATTAPPDQHNDAVAGLERGVWLQYQLKNGEPCKVRLAWVSPMRNVYIFTSSQKEHTFSVSAETLAQHLREGRAAPIELDKLVDHALQEALESKHAEAA